MVYPGVYNGGSLCCNLVAGVNDCYILSSDSNPSQPITQFVYGFVMTQLSMTMMVQYVQAVNSTTDLPLDISAVQTCCNGPNGETATICQAAGYTSFAAGCNTCVGCIKFTCAYCSQGQNMLTNYCLTRAESPNATEFGQSGCVPVNPLNAFCDAQTVNGAATCRHRPP